MDKAQTMSLEPAFTGGGVRAPPAAEHSLRAPFLNPPAASNQAKKTRLLGMYLEFLAMFYPEADLQIHRVGDKDAAADIEMKEGVVASPFVIQRNDYYRVTMTNSGAANEAWVGWSKASFPSKDFTGEEFTKLFKLGEDFEGTGKIMMFTVHTNDIRAW